MTAVLILLLSFGFASHMKTDNLHDFLQTENVAYSDQRSFILIDPDGASPINLAAHIERLEGKLMIILLKPDIHFSRNWYAIYVWPEVKAALSAISQTGLSPKNLDELRQFDYARKP
jgi:hypothetical protein